jgi:hypothetical protein
MTEIIKLKIGEKPKKEPDNTHIINTTLRK